jgi:hypothetical protein
LWLILEEQQKTRRRRIYMFRKLMFLPYRLALNLSSTLSGPPGHGWKPDE